jgi:gliding motility-associated-like protein
MMQFFRKCLLGVSFVTALLWGQTPTYNLSAFYCVPQGTAVTIRPTPSSPTGGVYSLNPLPIAGGVTINPATGFITIVPTATASQFAITYNGTPVNIIGATNLNISRPDVNILNYNAFCDAGGFINPTNPADVRTIKFSPAGLDIDVRTGIINTAKSLAASYTIINEGTDANNCSFSLSTPLDLNFSMSLISKIDICEGGALQLPDDISGAVFDNITNYEIAFPKNPTVNYPNLNPTPLNPIIVDYTGVWTVTGYYNRTCKTTQTIDVTVKPQPKRPALLKFESCEISRETEFDILRYTIVQPGEIGDLTWQVNGLLDNGVASLVSSADPDNKVGEWVITIPVNQPFTTVGGNFNIINTIATNPPLAGCTTIPLQAEPFNLIKPDFTIGAISPACSGYEFSEVEITTPVPADIYNYGFLAVGEKQYQDAGRVQNQQVGIIIQDPAQLFSDLVAIDKNNNCKFSQVINTPNNGIQSLNGWDGKLALTYDACIADVLGLGTTPYTYLENNLKPKPQVWHSIFDPTFDPAFGQTLNGIANPHYGTVQGAVLLPQQTNFGVTNNKDITPLQQFGALYDLKIGKADIDIDEDNGQVLDYQKLLLQTNTTGTPNGYNIYQIPYTYVEALPTRKNCVYEHNATLYVGPRRVPDAGRVWIGEVGNSLHDFSNGYDAVTGGYADELGDYRVTQEPGKYTSLPNILRHQAGVYSAMDYTITPIRDPADVTKTVDPDKLKTKSSYEIELRDNVTTCGATHLATIEPRDIDKFFKLKSEIKQCYGEPKMAQEFFEVLDLAITDNITLVKDIENGVETIYGIDYKPDDKLDQYKSQEDGDLDVLLNFAVTDITGVRYTDTEINNEVRLVLLEKQDPNFTYNPNTLTLSDRDRNTVLNPIYLNDLNLLKHEAPGAFWIEDPRFAGLNLVNDVTGQIRVADFFQHLQILKKGDEYFDIKHKTANGCAQSFEKLIFDVNIKTFDGFSPNGDDKNALFFIENIEYFPYLNIEVYNQNGDLLFRQAGYDNTWDGRVNQRQSAAKIGTKLDAGVYHYIIRKAEGYSPVIGTFEIRY